MFKKPFFLTQRALELLEDHGAIINISSSTTHIVTPFYSAYASAKAALENLTVYLAKEPGTRGIRVNSVAPGATETNFGGGVVRNDKTLNDQIASQVALGSVDLPEDIGPVVVFLYTDKTKWITGQRL